LIGLLREAEGLAAIYLNKKNITLSLMMDLFRATAQKADPEDEIHRLFGGDMAQTIPTNSGGHSAPDVFAQFGRDLTRLALENKLDPVIGRDNEVQRIIRILSRRTKNSPVLIGDPGVGKTAIVEGLAQAIINGEVPEDLKNKRVIELQLSSILAGTRFRGDFEERFKRLIDEATSKNSQIILFIDELHTVVGAGSVGDNAMDAANILKPALARGEMQCIGATTIDEYRKYIEKDAALERRFQKIDVSEPSKEEAILILQGLRDKYEAYHRVDIDDEVIRTAVEMSARYITDRFLPDKAIDLIDEAAAMVRLHSISLPDNIKEAQKELQSVKKDEVAAARNQEYEKAARYRDRIDQLEKWISEEREAWMAKKGANIVKIRKEDIQRVVADWTKMPVTALKENETQKYLDIDRSLQKKIVGQKDAIDEISRVLKRARSGLKNPDRPIGSFLFAGPTGVGKTELANVLTEYILGDRHKIIRFDMSEYMEKFNVSKLLGAPPGYVGYDEAGQLTEKVRRNPYSVILFDEIEKAHPEIFNVLLQILDSGTMTDGQGRKVDFKNCLIIMTTNMGSSQLKNLGFRSSDVQSAYETLKQNVIAEVKNNFRVEFINRLSGIVVFKPLIRSDMDEIFGLMVHNIEDRLAEQGLTLEISSEIRDRIIEESDFEQYGARSLGRIIERDIEDFLAQALLAESHEKGTRLVLSLNKKHEMTLKAHASR
jgi:ATP-dependent Clp protease ATP-binding subunit ClpC